MFCSQCGKRVMDTMLFCPFCGSPIVIPEQDEVDMLSPAETAEAVVEWSEKESVAEDLTQGDGESVIQDEDEVADEEEAFVPLSMEEISKPSPVRDDVSRQISAILNEQLREEPVRLQGHAPDLSNVHRPETSAGTNTIVPQKQLGDGDLFMDDEDEYDKLDDYDEYDDYDAADEYDGEDDEETGFFVRHIRGIVALILFAVVAAIFVGWAFSHGGQVSLAKAGLAWRADAYNELGYEAYEEKNFVLAAEYYVKAYERDSGNYDLANSAGVAYYLAKNYLKAEEYAQLAIGIDPGKVQAYELLQRLYPDMEKRPLEIQALLQNGYRLTGKSSLVADDTSVEGD